ncbi:MAG: hypothetical protein R3F11_16230 [Verrucomicrobiales bacterium]
MKSLKVSALHQSEKADFEGAIAEVKRMTSLCELLHEGEGYIVHSLVVITAAAIIDRAIEEIADQIADGHQPYATELQEILEKRNSARNCVKFSFNVEYIALKGTIIGLDEGEFAQFAELKLPLTAPGKSPSPFVFKPNETILRLAEWCRVPIRNLDRAYYSEWEVAADLLQKPPVHQMVLSGNFVGETILAIGLPVYDKILVRVIDGETRTQLTILKLALRRHELDRGSLPDSLDALVPDYLEAVPVDPYDGKPLRYSKEGRFVYSVGIDLVDGGGSPEDKLGPDVPDPTIKLVGYGE